MILYTQLIYRQKGVVASTVLDTSNVHNLVVTKLKLNYTSNVHILVVTKKSYNLDSKHIKKCCHSLL